MLNASTSAAITAAARHTPRYTAHHPLRTAGNRHGRRLRALQSGRVCNEYERCPPAWQPLTVVAVRPVPEARSARSPRTSAPVEWTLPRAQE
ncbi:MAG: hypothetical protein MZV70_41720 [Desulfobacterales bacterium]|nr:hypothetical protein [Desulfobacterales bacterium]